MLNSNFLKEKATKMRTPAVWGEEISYNGRFFIVGWCGEPTVVNMYQVFVCPGRNGFWQSIGSAEVTISVAITAIPTHLATATNYLLPGETGDDLARILFLPAKGPPEIKYLRVTLNQLLEKLAARSAEKLGGMWDRSEWPPQYWSSDMESEEAAVSADEDAQGYLDYGLEESSDRESEEAISSADEDGSGDLDSD